MKLLLEYRYRALLLFIPVVGFVLMLPYIVWWKLVVCFFLVMSVFLFYRESSDDIRTKLFWIWFGILFLVFFLSRVYPFFLSSVPLGYDTGIYRMEFEFSAQSLPEYVSNIFLGLPLITNLQHLLGFSIDSIISGWYVFWSLVLGFAVFTFARETFGDRKSIGIFFLFVVSVTQWQAFQFMLYKHIVALSFVLISFLFIQRRSYLVLFPLFFLALLQPPDFLFLVFSVGVYFLLSFRDTAVRSYLLGLIIPGIAISLLLLLQDNGVWKSGIDLILQSWNQPESVDPILQSGIFMSLSEYLQLSLVFVSFALLGFAFYLYNRKVRLITSAFAVVFVLVFGRFLFHDRFLVEFDLMIIFLAGALIVPLFDLLWREYLGRIVAVVLALFLSFSFGSHLYREGSWISSTEILRIQSYCSALPSGAFIMATDSRYAPWIAAYSCHRTIAPGMFEWNQWSHDEWRVFWGMNDLPSIKELMNRYRDQEIYLYIGENQPQIVLSDELFELQSSRLWRWKN